MPGIVHKKDSYLYCSDSMLSADSTDVQFPGLSGDLFPKDGVRPSDVKQGSLGECFFDATLLAIIQQNPYWLQHILQQTEDGQVVARVYIPNDEGELQAQYIRLDYTDFQPADLTENLFHRHANYVVMLEKAYAAACQLADKGPKKPLTKYLSGGQPADVMKTFCGELSAVINISADGSQNSFIRSAFNKLLQREFSCNAVELLMTLQKIKDVTVALLSNPEADIDAVLENQGFCDDEATFKKELEDLFKDGKNRDNQTLMGLILNLPYLMLALGSHEGISDANFHKQFPLPQLAGLAKILNENQHEFDKRVFMLCADYVLDSARRYTKVEIEIFKQIEEGLKNHQQVTFSTDPNLKGTQSEGHAGESLSNGLVARHAYGVVGAFEAADGKKYIRIRNPWGTTGSQYIDRGVNNIIQRRAFDQEEVGVAYAPRPHAHGSAFVGDRGHDPGRGVSDIELSDFIHNGVAVTLSPPPLPYDLVVQNLKCAFRYFSKHLCDGPLKEASKNLWRLLSSDVVLFRDFFEQMRELQDAVSEATPLADSLMQLAADLCRTYDQDREGLTNTTLSNMNQIISDWGTAISSIGGNNARDLVVLLKNRHDQGLNALLKQEDNSLYQLILAYAYLSHQTILPHVERELLDSIEHAIIYENSVIICQNKLGLLDDSQYRSQGDAIAFSISVKNALKDEHDLIRRARATCVENSTPDQLEAFDLMWQQQILSLTRDLIQEFKSGKSLNVLELQNKFKAQRLAMPSPLYFPQKKDGRLISLIKHHPYAAAAMISGSLMTALGIALVCTGITSPIGLLFVAAGLKTMALAVTTIAATTAVSMAVAVGGVAAVKKVTNRNKASATAEERAPLLGDRHRLFATSDAGSDQLQNRTALASASDDDVFYDCLDPDSDPDSDNEIFYECRA